MAVRPTALLARQLQRSKDLSVDVGEVGGEEVGHHCLFWKQLRTHDRNSVVVERTEDAERGVQEKRVGKATSDTVALRDGAFFV